MGVVNLARVDQRLIHGQVMLTLSKRAGVNSLFVVDDAVAQDKFMKNLYKSAGARTGQKTIVMTEEKCKYYWDEFKFKEYSCILITKTIRTIYDLVTYGIPMQELNIGGIAQQAPTDIMANKAVYLNLADAKLLKDLNENHGVSDIYFQSTPAAPKTELKSVLAKFEL
ncbi:PTS system mannose/fructose/N-acetylgalactosamine-transporter subunit IIB [Lacticaseibacillus nasuensis]|uniref:PTS system, IIB component n=1 Tax=Lacticaseibacillus nasuensis JCM 17158 TaxID=1291734 RepID=A0A0R1JYJ4_9LACO|nr:PTS sugar transporter subunit IIB [Lacticaseibacillus nasuensis]KRK72954.1 PTS system, IIB component [Lacticaseibacillus nasuensis JCM 17158]MCX2455153.1 PTS sugar transporter subunit IIB [Lacticaseibacillus nasuensis]